MHHDLQLLVRQMRLQVLRFHALASSPPIPIRPVGPIHFLKDLRQLLRPVPVLEHDPCRLEPRLGFIQRLGATERWAGNVDGDGPQP